MIYYFTDIVLDEGLAENRKFKNSEAGKLRSLYILNSIKQPITIVSMATPEKKGIFKSKYVKHDNIEIKYLTGFQLNVFFNLLFYFAYIIFFIFRNINKNDTILLYNFIPKQTLPILFLKRIVGFRLIVEIEELYSSKRFGYFKNKLNKFTEKNGMKIADKFIVVNSYIKSIIHTDKQVLINRGYLTKKIDTTSFSIESRKIRILYSGRLDYDGGIEILLKAIENINFNCELVITGSGPLKIFVENYNVSNPQVKMIYLGFVGNKEYSDILKKSDVCINPIRINNRFDKASFPSKVLTYLANGNLVVSSYFYAIDDLPDSLKENILIFKDNNPIELAKALNESKQMILENNFNKTQCQLNTYRFFKNQTNELANFFKGL